MNLKDYFLLVLFTTGLFVKTSEAVCGGQLQGRNGSFSTPGFPQNYNNNALCVWRVTLARGSTLNITFVEFFTEQCCDILEIRNASSSRYFSGDLMPFHVTTTSHDDNEVIIIDFSSDRSVNEKGFMAYYTITRPPPHNSVNKYPSIISAPIGDYCLFIPTPSSNLVPRDVSLAPKPGKSPWERGWPSSKVVVTTPTSATPATTKPPIIGCGGMLDDSSGSFMSPGYPGYYSNNLNCIWTLRIPADGYLRLKFIVFHTEQCCDFVELLDSAQQKIDVLRGYKPLYTVTVNGNRTDLVKIRFDSDSSVRRKGFLAQYHIITLPRSTSTSAVSFSAPTTVIPTASSAPSSTALPTLTSTPATAVLPTLSSNPFNTTAFTVRPSTSSLTPVMSSSISPAVILPPDVQRVLVDLISSLSQIMQKVTGFLGKPITAADFEQFRNETLQILLQIQNQLLAPTPTLPSNMQIAKRAIPEMANLQDAVQMLENIQRRLLG